MFYRNILAVSLALAGTVGVHAATDSKDPFPLSAESTEQFREQAATLRSDMDEGKFPDLSTADKNEIEELLVELDGLYVKRGTNGHRAETVETAAINANSEINSLLTGNSEDKLVCEQVKRVGSNRSTKICMTVADRREERHKAEKFILDVDRPSIYRGKDD